MSSRDQHQNGLPVNSPPAQPSQNGGQIGGPRTPDTPSPTKSNHGVVKEGSIERQRKPKPPTTPPYPLPQQPPAAVAAQYAYAVHDAYGQSVMYHDPHYAYGHYHPPPPPPISNNPFIPHTDPYHHVQPAQYGAQHVAQYVPPGPQYSSYYCNQETRSSGVYSSTVPAAQAPPSTLISTNHPPPPDIVASTSKIPPPPLPPQGSFIASTLPPLTSRSSSDRRGSSHVERHSHKGASYDTDILAGAHQNTKRSEHKRRESRREEIYVPTSTANGMPHDIRRSESAYDNLVLPPLPPSDMSTSNGLNYLNPPPKPPMLPQKSREPSPPKIQNASFSSILHQKPTATKTPPVQTPGSTSRTPGSNSRTPGSSSIHSYRSPSPPMASVGVRSFAHEEETKKKFEQEEAQREEEEKERERRRLDKLERQEKEAAQRRKDQLENEKRERLKRKEQEEKQKEARERAQLPTKAPTPPSTEDAAKKAPVVERVTMALPDGLSTLLFGSANTPSAAPTRPVAAASSTPAAVKQTPSVDTTKVAASPATLRIDTPGTPPVYFSSSKPATKTPTNGTASSAPINGSSSSAIVEQKDDSNSFSEAACMSNGSTSHIVNGITKVSLQNGTTTHKLETMQNGSSHHVNGVTKVAEMTSHLINGHSEVVVNSMTESARPAPTEVKPNISSIHSEVRTEPTPRTPDFHHRHHSAPKPISSAPRTMSSAKSTDPSANDLALRRQRYKEMMNKKNRQSGTFEKQSLVVESVEESAARHVNGTSTAAPVKAHESQTTNDHPSCRASVSVQHVNGGTKIAKPVEATSALVFPTETKPSNISLESAMEPAMEPIAEVETQYVVASMTMDVETPETKDQLKEMLAGVADSHRAPQASDVTEFVVPPPVAVPKEVASKQTEPIRRAESTTHHKSDRKEALPEKKRRAATPTLASNAETSEFASPSTLKSRHELKGKKDRAVTEQPVGIRMDIDDPDPIKSSSKKRHLEERRKEDETSEKKRVTTEMTAALTVDVGFSQPSSSAAWKQASGPPSATRRPIVTKAALKKPPSPPRKPALKNKGKKRARESVSRSPSPLPPRPSAQRSLTQQPRPSSPSPSPRPPALSPRYPSHIAAIRLSRPDSINAVRNGARAARMEASRMSTQPPSPGDYDINDPNMILQNNLMKQELVAKNVRTETHRNIAARKAVDYSYRKRKQQEEAELAAQAARMEAEARNDETKVDSDSEHRSASLLADEEKVKIENKSESSGSETGSERAGKGSPSFSFFKTDAPETQPYESPDEQRSPSLHALDVNIRRDDFDEFKPGPRNQHSIHSSQDRTRKNAFDETLMYIRDDANILEYPEEESSTLAGVAYPAPEFDSDADEVKEEEYDDYSYADQKYVPPTKRRRGTSHNSANGVNADELTDSLHDVKRDRAKRQKETIQRALAAEIKNNQNSKLRSDKKDRSHPDLNKNLVVKDCMTKNQFTRPKVNQRNFKQVVETFGLPVMDDRFHRFIKVTMHPNGGASYLTCDYRHIKAKLGRNRAEVREFFRQFIAIGLAEVNGGAIFAITVVENGGEDLEDIFLSLSNNKPTMPVKIADLTKPNLITTMGIKAYYESAIKSLDFGTYRVGPMNALTMVGVKSEECGGVYPELLSKFDRHPFLSSITPWGKLSSLEGMELNESDDGPIFWVRPGEQTVPTDYLKNFGKKERDTRQYEMPIRGQQRMNERREHLVLDRTAAHADQINDPVTGKTSTAAVGVLQAVMDPAQVSKHEYYPEDRLYVKDVIVFSAEDLSVAVNQLYVDLYEPPAGQCEIWIEDAKLNAARREGLHYAKLQLRHNDMYFIPRNVVHQFRTIAACSSIAWHVRLKQYHEPYVPDENQSSEAESGQAATGPAKKK